MVRSINQYLKSNDLAFEVLDEFKIDVYKIRGLVGTLLSSDGTQQIQQRIALANAQKNFQNAITMDAEDDYIQKQLSFSGLAEIMREIRMQIASDLRMPLTKIFGISAAGFNAGEDDIENYNGMVEGEIRSKCKYDILRVLEMMCQKEFGFIPDDLAVEFKPLRILSAEQQENVKNSKFTRLVQARTMGLISEQEFRIGINSDDLLPMKLEMETDTLELESGDMAKEPAADQEEIGASRIDTQQYATGSVYEKKEAP